MVEEEKKHHKKIKPVIEEITDDGPVSSIEEREPIAAEVQEEVAAEEQTLPETHIDHPVHTYPTSDESVNVENLNEKSSDSGFRISFSFIFITLAVAAFVAILSGALYVYFNGVSSLKMVGATPTASPVATSSSNEATPSPSVSPSPLPRIDTYKVSVLNGNGKAGVASAGQKVMEGAGFKVTKAGNAANFNFEKTVIQAKGSVPATVIAQATQALDKNYEVEVGTKLEENNAYDIIVTIGAK